MYYKIVDPYKAWYNVVDHEFAIHQLVLSTIRAEIGKMTLETVLQERANINNSIAAAVNQVCEDWGIECLRCELRDINPPAKVVAAMEQQAISEREKRQKIIQSEGEHQAFLNQAVAKKTARILDSEAASLEKANISQAEAEALVFFANATAKGLAVVANALTQNQGSNDAMALKLASDYVSAFGQLTKSSNQHTILLPAGVADITSTITQLLHVGKSILPPNSIKDIDKQSNRQ